MPASPRRSHSRIGVQLDLTRIVELQEVLAADLPEIIDSLVQSSSSAITRIEAAIAAGDLEAAARAVHQARNDALMFGANQLLDTLAQLEQAARGGRLEGSVAALERLRLIWPEVRRELERLAREPTG